jgi:uncharacterized protein YbjQ (UPF0145 family)
MDDSLGEVRQTAEQRLGSGSFSSGLTVPDFAACLHMGLRPVGLVQGFCVMHWGWYGAGSPYLRGTSPFQYTSAQSGGYAETWQCPHGFVSGEHRMWGQNYEQTWVEDAWSQGFGSAYTRLMDEAKEAGAHGVVGIVDTSRSLTDAAVTEFHIIGTAVVVEDAPRPSGEPWSTYLAGQRLAKLIEAGFMPVSVVAAMASVRVWAYCMTEFLMEGRPYTWGATTPGTQEVEQVISAQLSARALAREHARHQLGSDLLHGASVSVAERELSEGDMVVDCTLRGTRARRFKASDPLPVPRPTVRLS